MRRLWLVPLALLMTTNVGRGQRLYNKELDTAAQQALKAVEKVDSKTLFDRQLENLATLSKQDFETVFSGIQRTTRAQIQAWDSWCNVHAEMARIATMIGYPGAQKPDSAELYQKDNDEQKQKEVCGRLLEFRGVLPDGEVTEWNSRLKELKGQQEALEKQIRALISRLGDLDAVEQGILTLSESSWGGKLKGLTEPAARSLAILKKLNEAYSGFRARREEIRKVRQELAELKAEMLKVSLAKLAAEEEHLKRLLGIEARRAKELQDIAESLQLYRNTIACEKQQRPDLDLMNIAESFQELGQKGANETVKPLTEFRLKALELEAIGLGKAEDRERARLKVCAQYPGRKRLGVLAQALYEAAAVEAHGQTPAYFAELRRAQEEQRYSIVRSALEARRYETLVSTGVQRLALLHAGGVKPEQVAQLVYQAAQLAGISVIAAKQ